MAKSRSINETIKQYRVSLDRSIASPFSRLLQSNRFDNASGGARAFDAEDRLEARRVHGVVRVQQQAIALGLALLLELHQVSDRGLAGR
jgi:hypothetical protein